MNPGRAAITDRECDDGVIAVKGIHHYFKKNKHATINMPASWRPSRGAADPEFALDEIRALAGVDRMTIPAPLLEKLAASEDVLERMLHDGSDRVDDGLAGDVIVMDEKTFRYEMNLDGCTTMKMAEGLRAFIDETNKLQAAIEEKVKERN